MDKSKTYKISVKNTDISFPCNENQCVLEAMIKSHSGPIECGCFGGGCGVCKMKVVRGKYEIIKRMSNAHISNNEKDLDIVLMCCIEPRENLTIEKIKK